MQVDVAGSGALVAEEVGLADEGCRDGSDCGLSPVGPRLGEGNAFNGHQDVDTNGRHADLVCEAFAGEIIRCKAGQWRAEACERGEDLGVFSSVASTQMSRCLV